LSSLYTCTIVAGITCVVLAD